MRRGGVCPPPGEGGVLAGEFVKSCEACRRKWGEDLGQRGRRKAERSQVSPGGPRGWRGAERLHESSDLLGSSLLPAPGTEVADPAALPLRCDSGGRVCALPPEDPDGREVDLGRQKLPAAGAFNCGLYPGGTLGLYFPCLPRSWPCLGAGSKAALRPGEQGSGFVSTAL